MDDQYANTREAIFVAVRSLAASAEPLETRIVAAASAIVQVTIDQFDGDVELKTKFARNLDLLAVDERDLEAIIPQTVTDLSEWDTVGIAELICDLLHDL